MLNDLRGRINEFITRANDALIYDSENIINLRSHIVGALANLYALRTHIESISVPAGSLSGITPSATERLRKRYALVLPAQGLETRERILFFIDGIVTESKIQAIKQVRTVDNIGLKEAKDFVDGLADRPYVLPANFGYVEVF